MVKIEARIGWYLVGTVSRLGRLLWDEDSFKMINQLD